MATNHVRIPQRRTTIAQRAKADENAMSRHLRQPSNVAAVNAARFLPKEVVTKVNVNRQVLSEVTTATVNRRDAAGKLVAGMTKDKEEVGLKRNRSNSTTLAQRVPLGPGRSQVAPPLANIVNARAPSGHARLLASGIVKRAARAMAIEQVIPIEELDVKSSDIGMDVEDDHDAELEEEQSLLDAKNELEAMIGDDDSDDEGSEMKPRQAKRARIWPEVSTERAHRYEREIQKVKETYEDEIDIYDTTMVSEYAEEIYGYMNDLEETMMPNADYMCGQNEINWGMRQTLVNWLLQVHLRYRMVPETLWITINIIDRFLSKRVVSLNKLQLVGVTAMFIAAKYEEILAPSVEEFVAMTENGYTKDEILKGERIMLQTLEFRVSHYCSPYSWMRRISKADDYDIQTRTLSKFLIEVTLLDYRFLRVKPSLIAAIGMYCARKMLGGEWNDAFVFQSEFTEEQLLPGHSLLVNKLVEEHFTNQNVCKKYANRKFLKASLFAVEWAKMHIDKTTPVSVLGL